MANYLPTGVKTERATVPTYLKAAGIQQPFGGKDPNDPLLKMYMASHPEMMRLAGNPGCLAVQNCELRTLIDPTAPTPDWASLVVTYRHEADTEIYTTAAFDPWGLMRYR